MDHCNSRCNSTVGTPQQNHANGRNSRLSHGPQTPQGKARSAKNALKHGLLSRGVLLPDEDPEAFSELSSRLSEDLKPQGELELVLVEGSLICSGGCDGHASLKQAS
jgi:hypothetical protein